MDFICTEELNGSGVSVVLRNGSNMRQYNILIWCWAFSRILISSFKVDLLRSWLTRPWIQQICALQCCIAYAAFWDIYLIHYSRGNDDISILPQFLNHAEFKQKSQHNLRHDFLLNTRWQYCTNNCVHNLCVVVRV